MQVEQSKVNCTIYLSTKPAIDLWYYLGVYLTPCIPLSFFDREGEGREEGLAPLLDASVNRVE